MQETEWPDSSRCGKASTMDGFSSMTSPSSPREDLPGHQQTSCRGSSTIDYSHISYEMLILIKCPISGVSLQALQGK